MSEEIILRAENVSKAFGGVQALYKVNLTIHRGEIHCLAGGNGSGKSTLINIISGYYKLDEGIIEICGREYSRLTPIESIRQGVQIIYQDLSIFPNLTVAENIAINYQLYNKIKFINWKSVKEIAKTAMERVGINLPLNEKVENLSVADKQLIAIARAILHNAKLIIMDEPTTALTRREIKKLFEIIRKLQRYGIAILFVSHKLDEVFEIAENFTIIRNGKNVITDSTRNVDNNKFIYYMTGKEITGDLFNPTNIDYTRPILEVKNIGVKKGFENISFKVYPGEILGITGLLGSGRTELAKSIFGIYPIEKGSILIDGKGVKISNPHDALKHKIGYVPEDRLSEGLSLPQPIRENMVLANIDNFLKKSKTVDFNSIDESVDFWEKELSIMMNNKMDPIRTLSGGNQQKIVLSKWLEIKPRVLILNGPTVGVDISAKSDLHRYLRELVKDHSVAVIIISDDISEVVRNCNRILIMKQGRLSGEFKNTEISEHGLLNEIISQEVSIV